MRVYVFILCLLLSFFSNFHFCVSVVKGHLGETMTLVGTSAWQSPEVIQGLPYTEKADIYAFGIVLWEVVTCAQLYPNMATPHILVSVATKNLRPQLDDSIPLYLQQIMASCWHVDPGKRPSFQEVLEVRVLYMNVCASPYRLPLR
jgi:serine/threonine protein kinase